VHENEWARFAEARSVRAGGADTPCNPMPLHSQSRIKVSMSFQGQRVTRPELKVKGAICSTAVI
jgi:hypothetical protein